MSKNGWSEYGRLVLNELKRLNDVQENLKEDINTKLNDLNTSITNFKNTERDVEGLKKWKDKVTEVWSVPQMKQSKDEIYKQKGYWLKGFGIIIAIQIVISLIVALSDKIF